jgi:Ca2+/Na+ antiporter
VPLIIGLMFAFLGLRFGRDAIYKSTKKHAKEMTEDEIHERKKKVKRSYLLNLFAILLFFLYLLLRFGIVAAFNIYGLAVLLVAIALVLYLLFRMGVFRDLKAMKN